jgi:putative transposase
MHPNRKIARLQRHDYSDARAYFITICTYKRKCILGEIINDIVVPSEFGLKAERVWLDLPIHWQHLSLDSYIFMPNHFHGILHLHDHGNSTPMKPDSEELKRVPTHEFGKPVAGSLPTIVGLFKSTATKEAKACQGISKVWQSRYYDRIIRDEEELFKIRQYIQTNPERWELDKTNPEGLWM